MFDASPRSETPAHKTRPTGRLAPYVPLTRGGIISVPAGSVDDLRVQIRSDQGRGVKARGLPGTVRGHVECGRVEFAQDRPSAGCASSGEEGDVSALM
jgi:hypothetical protein